MCAGIVEVCWDIGGVLGWDRATLYIIVTSLDPLCLT